MSVTYVSASVVREWALSRGYAIGTRGLLPQSVINAFNKAHRVKQYIVGQA